jgi:putative flippase GtrA
MADNILSLFIGEVCAWLIILIGRNLAVENAGVQVLLPYFKYLPFVFPLICLAGMLIARLLRNLLPIIYQLAKFILVGGLNFLIDMGVLNFLIFSTGVSTGLVQSGFKSLSFLVAVTNSYVWNRHWTFKNEADEAQESVSQEFFQFFIITVIGFSINVGIDYILVNIVSPFWEMPLKTWAQFSALLATLVQLVLNFLGYKFIVFNTKK